jgi:hypothetical protein
MFWRNEPNETFDVKGFAVSIPGDFDRREAVSNLREGFAPCFQRLAGG